MEKEPKDFQLDEEKGFRSSEEKTALWLRSYYERMAACEVVLWGAVEAETAAEIERLTAEADRLAAERRAEKLEREERQRREAAEREERYRLEREERERQRMEREERERPAVEDKYVAQYIPGEDKADPNDSEFWSKAVERAKGGVVGMVYIPPEPESKPPPDDGTESYQRKLTLWKLTGRWEPDPWELDARY